MLGNPLEQGAQTYRLVFIDRVLDAACVLGHPGGVEYGDTGHAQYGRWQSEVDAGRRDLKDKYSTKWAKVAVRQYVDSQNPESHLQD